jgi:outer membrane protein assembly factor BamB
MRVLVMLILAAILFSSTPRAAAPVSWPQFRGPHAGVADESSLPVHWSTSENVAWSADVPGRGWSSPILWNDRVYVTAGISAGAFKAPSTGIFGNDYVAELQKQGLPMDEVIKRVTARDIELTSEVTDLRYMLYAIDAKTGKVVWEREAHKGKPFGGRHRKNTYASETPVTDGERLYVSFGANVGVFCYAMDGTLLWTKTWPPQPIYLDFGTAASPVIHGGRIYIQHDTDGESFLAALDKTTGKDVWSVKRTDLNATRLKSGWATPFVWENPLRTEIVTVGRGYIISYDVSGQELWRLTGSIVQAAPTPFAIDGVLYVTAGSQGESDRPVYAIKPRASGDISLVRDQTSSEFVLWMQPRMAGYTPSALVYRNRLYAVNDNGVLQVADAKTGKEVYKVRVGGGGNTFSSSPFASAGRIYAISEDGDAFVWEAGDQYKELAKNSLGEMTFATPAADANSLYIRTATKLYRIATR